MTGDFSSPLRVSVDLSFFDDSPKAPLKEPAKAPANSSPPALLTTELDSLWTADFTAGAEDQLTMTDDPAICEIGVPTKKVPRPVGRGSPGSLLVEDILAPAPAAAAPIPAVVAPSTKRSLEADTGVKVVESKRQPFETSTERGSYLDAARSSPPTTKKQGPRRRKGAQDTHNQALDESLAPVVVSMKDSVAEDIKKKNTNPTGQQNRGRGKKVQ